MEEYVILAINRLRNNIENFIRKYKVIHYLIILFIVALFLYPPFIRHTSFFRYFRIMQTLMTLGGLLIYALFYRKNWYINMSILFFSIYILSTLTIGNNTESIIYYGTTTLGLLIFSYIFNHIESIKFFKVTAFYLKFIIFMHVLTQILFQKGIIQVVTVNGAQKGIYLLGEGNQQAVFILLALTIISLNYYKNQERIITLSFFYLLGFIITIMSGSATALIGMVFFYVMTIGLLLLLKYFSKIRSLAKKVHWITMPVIGVGLIILMNALIVVFRIQYFFSGLIELILNKDASFTTRTGIWDVSLENIASSPLLGLGGRFNRFIYIPKTNNFFDSHNLLLEISNMGGLLLLAVFILMVYISLRNIYCIKFWKYKVIALTSMAALFIMSLSEVYSIALIMELLLILTFLSDYPVQTEIKKIGVPNMKDKKHLLLIASILLTLIIVLSFNGFMLLQLSQMNTTIASVASKQNTAIAPQNINVSLGDEQSSTNFLDVTVKLEGYNKDLKAMEYKFNAVPEEVHENSTASIIKNSGDIFPLDKDRILFTGIVPFALDENFENHISFEKDGVTTIEKSDNIYQGITVGDMVLPKFIIEKQYFDFSNHSDHVKVNGSLTFGMTKKDIENDKFNDIKLIFVEGDTVQAEMKIEDFVDTEMYLVEFNEKIKFNGQGPFNVYLQATDQYGLIHRAFIDGGSSEELDNAALMPTFIYDDLSEPELFIYYQAPAVQ